MQIVEKRWHQATLNIQIKTDQLQCCFYLTNWIIKLKSNLSIHPSKLQNLFCLSWSFDKRFALLQCRQIRELVRMPLTSHWGGVLLQFERIDVHQWISVHHPYRCLMIFDYIAGDSLYVVKLFVFVLLAFLASIPNICVDMSGGLRWFMYTCFAQLYVVYSFMKAVHPIQAISCTQNAGWMKIQPALQETF